MRRILVTGKNGQLGFELQRSLSVCGEVIAVGHFDCDLSDTKSVRELIRTIKPDIIINPAAYTAVDRAEREPALADAVNHLAVKAIGEEAELLRIPVVHYSTDYVYNGTKKTPYIETDATDPQCVYGKTKRDGEVALAQSCSRYLILRTSWVLGAVGNNFAKTMLRLAASKNSLNVVADQYGAPTTAALLADATAHVVARFCSPDDFQSLSGIYHVAASGKTNWHEYAQFVINFAHDNGVSLTTLVENVMPISTEAYPTPAIRPANSCLDLSKFQNSFKLVLPDWKIGVRHVLQQVLS